MVMYQRSLELNLPQGQSAFLWGARKTGKSTYLKVCYPQSLYYDFLKYDVFLRFSKAPHLLREDILALSKEELRYPIILDEIQKVPMLLDEIHWIIENTEAYFILCGSSARKLKRGAANLLGGRAWGYHFFPLSYCEISDFDLLKALTHGLIPSHYVSSQPKKMIKAYIEDYLREEIQAEGLVRNLPAFSRFLDALQFCHAEMLVYTNIARECGVDSKTVKEYFQILVDTLVGYLIPPYARSASRQMISSVPKFYLLDVGVAHLLCKKTVVELKGDVAGKALEHLVLMELMAYRKLKDQAFDISFWRTKTGLEVDFILGEAQLALEVKISSQVEKRDLKGLLAFHCDYPEAKLIVVSQDPRPRRISLGTGFIDVLPWRIFFNQLWRGQFFSAPQ